MLEYVSIGERKARKGEDAAHLKIFQLHHHKNVENFVETFVREQLPPSISRSAALQLGGCRVPCLASGRQRGNYAAHYAQLGCDFLGGFFFLRLNQCEGGSGAGNEHGWNHRGQTGAHGLIEPVPLQTKKRSYSLHLHQASYIWCAKRPRHACTRFQSRLRRRSAHTRAKWGGCNAPPQVDEDHQ